MNMIIFQLLAVSFVMSVAAVLFLICSVVLTLVILIQKGKGGGLGAAFGGGLASGILGSKTGDFLTWVTISLVSVFLILAVVMAKFYKPTISDFGQGQVRQDQPISPRQQPAEDTGAVTGGNVPDINLLGDQNDL
jgi:preprotein translocase subunit SecG